jgi:hypothetical protein
MPSSNELSLFTSANAIAKLGHVGAERRKDNVVAPSAPPSRTSSSFALPFDAAIDERFSLKRVQLAAFSALASEPDASRSGPA